MEREFASVDNDIQLSAPVNTPEGQLVVENSSQTQENMQNPQHAINNATVMQEKETPALVNANVFQNTDSVEKGSKKASKSRLRKVNFSNLKPLVNDFKVGSGSDSDNKSDSDINFSQSGDESDDHTNHDEKPDIATNVSAIAVDESDPRSGKKESRHRERRGASKDPSIVPRASSFFIHDDRGGVHDGPNKSESYGRRRRPARDMDDVWKHDKYSEGTERSHAAKVENKSTKNQRQERNSATSRQISAPTKMRDNQKGETSPERTKEGISVRVDNRGTREVSRREISAAKEETVGRHGQARDRQHHSQDAREMGGSNRQHGQLRSGRADSAGLGDRRQQPSQLPDQERGARNPGGRSQVQDRPGSGRGRKGQQQVKHTSRTVVEQPLAVDVPLPPPGLSPVKPPPGLEVAKLNPSAQAFQPSPTGKASQAPHSPFLQQQQQQQQQYGYHGYGAPGYALYDPVTGVMWQGGAMTMQDGTVWYTGDPSAMQSPVSDSRSYEKGAVEISKKGNDSGVGNS